MKEAKVNVKTTRNWMSTLLFFPRITLGRTEDKTKTHAKAKMKTIISILENNQVPIGAQYNSMDPITVVTAVWVNNW